MTDIYIYHHLGLGDHINCNGLVRTLLKNKVKSNGNLYLLTKTQYNEMISFMYRDEPRIKIVTIKKNANEKQEVKRIIKSLSGKDHEFIKIGHEFYWSTSNLNLDKDTPWTADMIFYKQMNIPYELRYKKCYWLRDKEAEEKIYNELVLDKSKPYAFIHDEPERGFIIDDRNVSSGLSIVRNNPKENIFNFGLILEQASELHLMESAIRCMLETLDTSKSKHYLYRFTNGPWKSIPYYSKEKNIYVGTSKKWEFKDLEFTKKNN